MANEIIGRSSVVLPEPVLDNIIQTAQKQSAVMSHTETVKMQTGVAKQPVLALLPTASFVAPRDTGLKALTFAQWEGIELVAEDIAAVIAVPENVVDDATFDLWGALEPGIGTAVAAAVDRAALFGVGAPSSWPVGGIHDFAVNAGNSRVQGSVAGEDIAEDLNAVMGMVESDGYDADGFIIRRTIKRTLRGLRDDVGRPIFNPGLGGDAPDELYSEPVTYTSLGWQGLAANAFVGDWDMAIVGVRRDMTFKILTEATLQNPDGTIAYNLAQQDMVGLRCVMRLGFAIARPAAAESEAADRAHQSPFAVLLPPA